MFTKKEIVEVILTFFYFFKFHQLNLEFSLDNNLIILIIVFYVLMDTKVWEIVKD